MKEVLNNLYTLRKMLLLQTNITRQVTNNKKPYLYAGYPGLISEFGQPFFEKSNLPFMGTPRQRYKNCYEVLLCFEDLIYCEGYACNIPKERTEMDQRTTRYMSDCLKAAYFVSAL